jgi:hypothetical protein
VQFAARQHLDLGAYFTHDSHLWKRPRPRGARIRKENVAKHTLTPLLLEVILIIGRNGVAPEQVTVLELQGYWKDLDTALKAGSGLAPLSISEMPPWERICSRLDWELYRVDDGCFRSKRHGFCGVYRLFWLASDGNLRDPKPLDRVCGRDTTGTLYIGETGSLSIRLNQLQRSLSSRKENSHGTARMLREIPKLRIARNRLGIALMLTVTCTRAIEDCLIKAYMNSFGDTPPLNYRL